ncbi:MAG TPA: aminotransferase class I/II-fold pyridoxal phosphate-dependent enzyme [Gemmatimonadales bacterium]|jgi:threonine aldolase|nr:aminotransferase class I/II-fold pyridoxal phosphate-dependent enzyme [Gemmatimonadales bacterium]
MSMPRGFASDNTAPVHPAVLARLAVVNDGSAPPYGEDRWTAAALEWFREQFGSDSTAALVWNGTGANVMALRTITRPYHAVLCAETAHVQVDECGAPEFFTGCKLLGLASQDGKLTAEQVSRAVRGIGNEHSVQPRVVSIAQSSEYGTVYSVPEVESLCAAAHAKGLLVHMDGARIANAAASLGVPLRAFTRDAGVDILSFGITKNGAMGAEAVVAFDQTLAADFRYLRKQSAQLASKMRYLAAQVLALADGDLWLANAQQANAMAQRLAAGVRAIAGVTVTQPVQSSSVFALLPAAVVERLQRDFHFYVWNDLTGEVRWMTTWATTEADVDEFVAAIAGAMAERAPR